MTEVRGPVPEFRFPDDTTLERILASAMAGPGGRRAVTLLRRQPNPYASTFASEVVTFRGPAGDRTVFCKYQDSGERDPYGHRHGLDYEARVYREVLAPLAMGTPALYAATPRSHRDTPDAGSWLILETVENYMRLDKSPDPDAVARAARWIGRFHAAGEEHEGRRAPAFLRRYDDAYYRGWMRRTLSFAGESGSRPPWLDAIADRFDEVIARLDLAPRSIIHGEYYPHNILICDDAVRPIDWQSAAVGSGLVDLACQIDGWPEDETRKAVGAYAEARWPAGAPPDLDHGLDAAGIYVQLRWLGDRPEWTLEGGARFDRLRRFGVRLGLIDRCS